MSAAPAGPVCRSTLGGLEARRRQIPSPASRPFSFGWRRLLFLWKQRAGGKRRPGARTTGWRYLWGRVRGILLFFYRAGDLPGSVRPRAAAPEGVCSAGRGADFRFRERLSPTLPRPSPNRSEPGVGKEVCPANVPRPPTDLSVLRWVRRRFPCGKPHGHRRKGVAAIRGRIGTEVGRWFPDERPTKKERPPSLPMHRAAKVETAEETLDITFAWTETPRRRNCR